MGFLLFFAIVPVVILIGYSLSHVGGIGGLWDLLWGPGLAPQLARQALWNSLVQGSVSAALAALWGYPVGIFLGRSQFRWARTLRSLLLLPFILPSLVMVFGVVGLFGPQGLLGKLLPGTVMLSAGLPGIVLVNVLFNAPVVALYTAGTVESVPAHLEEAASVLGATPFAIYRTVWGRPSALGGALGGMLTFLFSFLSFAPPLLLGGPSYYTAEDWIYALDKFVGFSGPALASGLAVWTMLLLAGPLVAYMMLIRGTSLLGRGRGSLSPVRKSRPMGLGGYLLALATLGLVLLETLLLASVILLSFGLSHGAPTTSYWAELFSSHVTAVLQVSTAQAAFNTVFFAVIATAIVFATILFLQIFSPRASLRLEGLSFLPLLLSPVILAFGLTLAWGGTVGSPSTVWILIVVSQASLALPFALQGLSVAFRAHPPSLAEAASVLGATRFRIFSDVRLPLARTGVWTALLFTLAIGLGEFASTNFLYVHAFTTLVVEMYALQGVRLFGPGFAIGGLLVFMSLIVFLGLLVWRERRE